MANLKRYAIIASNIVSFTACLIHVRTIIMGISRGELRTKLKISTVDQIELPNVYICFLLPHIVNITYLNQINPSLNLKPENLLRDKFINSTLFRTLSTMRIRELLRALKNPDGIIESVQPGPSFSKRYERQVTQDNCQQSRLLLETSFCIKINCSYNGRPIVYNRHILTYGESGGHLLLVKFSPTLNKFATSFRVNMVPMSKVLYAKELISLVFDYHDSTSPFQLDVSFSVLKSHYEENEFYVQCKDYTKEGFKCRQDKSRDCHNQWSYGRIDAPFHVFSQPVTNETMNSRTGMYQSYLELLAPENRTRQFYRSLFAKFRKKCKAEIALPDCDDVTLKPIDKAVAYGQSNQSILTIKLPSQPASSNIFIPYYDVDDLIVYVQCAIGIWLGISPAMVIDWIVNQITDWIWPEKQSPGGKNDSLIISKVKPLVAHGEALNRSNGDNSSMLVLDLRMKRRGRKKLSVLGRANRLIFQDQSKNNLMKAFPFLMEKKDGQIILD